MVKNSIVKEISKNGDIWRIRYAIPYESFVESSRSPVNESTEQYGFIAYAVAGAMKINVNKVLDDLNVVDIEGLRITEALTHLQAYAGDNIKEIYRQVELEIDNTSEWYELCKKLEAGE